MLGPMLAVVRHPLRLALLVIMTALTACALSGRAQARPPKARAPVRYRVEIPAPHRQYVHVTMEVDAPNGRDTEVAMPAWAPGSYLVRDFGRHVYDLRATDRRDQALPAERLDKQTWRIEHGGRPFTVHYRVFADEPSVRTSHVDDHHASLIGSSIFLYVRGELMRPARVSIALPSGWSAHTALTSDETAPGVTRFTAPDYDTLVDAPIELGTPRVETFTRQGATFEYVLTGAENTAIDTARLVADAAAVVQAQGELMGGFPFSRYVFLMQVSEHGGGGLEHANSTSMMMRRRDFDTEEGYARAARLVAHEFFHLWNVKRIHDRRLGPFDYSRENHTRLLWLHEGLTETMEAHSLLRARLLTPQAYVRDLGRRWTRFLQKPGRNHDPIAQLSFDAWIKAYQPAANHPNVAISYYEKGDLLGIALDLELRLRSAAHDRQGSLPGMFRRLMERFGRTGRGIDPHHVTEAASAEAGEDMSDFFARYVEGTEEIPLPALLTRVGVQVHTSAPWLDDQGRPRIPLTRKQRVQRAWTGLELTPRATVHNVVPDSPADRAGLMLGDELVAVGSRRIRDRSDARARFADKEPGQPVPVTLFRGERLLEVDLTVGESPQRTIELSLAPADTLSPQVLALRTAWLGGT